MSEQSAVPQRGDLVSWPGLGHFVEVRFAEMASEKLLISYRDDHGLQESEVDPASIEIASEDGAADSDSLLAGLWAAWMASATTTAKSAALASSTLRPYPHQHEAVYRTMLPQPQLRFMLGDEPGTGKTIMGGLYAREAQRLGTVDRCLVVCPAHLVTKWIADFERFFGGGLRRIENSTVKEKALESGLQVGDNFWVVSLELAAMNPAVLEAIRPDRAGWDLVIVDEAHRMTSSAESYYAVGRVLKDAPNFLAMTATPHRGNEQFFRALMHLVDPDVYPAVNKDAAEVDHRLKPGTMHLLRRMKEELFGYDGQERLFKERYAENIKAHLSAAETIVYNEAQEHINSYFPDNARTLGQMVYGKRAASCLWSLRTTLERRRDLMGTKSEVEAKVDGIYGDPDGDDDASADHAQVIYANSKNARAEKKAIGALIGQIDVELANPDPATQSSKWSLVIDKCLKPHDILPGNGEQAVVFTEYADTADWLVDQFRKVGYTTERYSGRDGHAARDEARDRFMAGEFQIIVSTDAGNEGIDLQSAHVLINWDIPWSLVTLEQRMGRIHRVGQKRDVLLYNVIATGTLEGDTYARLLDRLVDAANEMKGKMFDCLSLLGDRLFKADDAKKAVPLIGLFDVDRRHEAIAAVDAITKDQMRIAAQQALADSNGFNSTVDTELAVKAIQDGEFERINPHIVERFLTRLAKAGLVSFSTSSLTGIDGGLFDLTGTASFPLPNALSKSNQSTLVATFADAKTKVIEQGERGASKAITLGPAEAPFRELVAQSLSELRPSLLRGGMLQDETSISDYTLFLYETDVKIGAHKVKWRHLVKADIAGSRVVPFEILANLNATGGEASSPHPAAKHDSHASVVAQVEKQQAERRASTDRWKADARRHLNRLPGELVKGIESSDERNEIRTRAKNAVAGRIASLDSATIITVGEPVLVGWAQVRSTGLPEEPTRANSEWIAMKKVSVMLSDAGWNVSDVHTEDVGYDLRASKGSIFRAVEVKGVWESASTHGVRLTGNEIAKAGLLGDDYWLYVVDQCHDHQGTLYASYKNPGTVFAELGKDVAVVRLLGSDLKKHKTVRNAA